MDAPIKKYQSLFNRKKTSPQPQKEAVKQRKKDSKPFYTEEQWQRAQAHNNALDYARHIGHPVKKEGNYYRSKLHSSLVFKENGYFNWNKQGIEGDALDFITKVEGKTFVEAVYILSGDNISFRPSHTVFYEKQEKKDMQLPNPAQSNKAVYAYLTQTRKIAPALVQQMLNENKIYQEEKHNNLVFVGFDMEGTPKYGAIRSTKTQGKQYKFDVTHSNKSYPFAIEGRNDTVCVFEAPIDAMSYWTLCDLNGMDAYKQSHMISLGGVDTAALDRYLKDHPKLKNIMVCVDNDEAGHNCAQRIAKQYVKTYQVKRLLPDGKDFNDTLKLITGNKLEQKLQTAKEKSIESKQVKSAKTYEKAI